MRSDDEHRSRESLEAEEASLDACRADEEQGPDCGKDAGQCSVPIRPGFGTWAFKRGCEDEYSDGMGCRYGGEW
jgi:hypothetical protein